MAKKSNRVRASINIQRHPRVRAQSKIRHALPRRVAPIINQYQDNRTWHPERAFRPALSILRRGAVRSRPLVLKKPTPYQTPRLTEPLRFVDPKKAIVCIKRNARKRVLHAKKIAGSGGLRKPRRNHLSEVSC